MNIRQADLNLFVVFDLIYSEGSLTGTARQLGLTQPAVSHALARLRELLEDPLFVRQGHRMVPTPLARRLIEPVRKSLNGLELTLSRLEQFDPATAHRRLVLGLHDALEPLLLPPLMQAIQDQAPNIELAVVHMARRDLQSELTAGNMDAAVDVFMPISANVMSRRLFSHRLVVLARKNHPQIGKPLDLESYLAQGHIHVSARRQGYGLVETELSRLGVQRRVMLRCQHYHAACDVVSRTDLLLTLPENQAEVVNRSIGNQILPFPIDEPAQVAYLYWRTTADEDPANTWLRSLLHQVVQQWLLVSSV